MFNSDLTQNRC